MVNKPRVGVDLDEVLCDFNGRFLQVSRKLLGRPEKGFQIKNYDYTKAGWSKKELDRIWNYIRHTEDFWMTLERRPNTSALGRREPELDYFFITSRISTDGLPTVYQSEEWLRRNFGLKGPYVTVSSEKGKLAVELELDWFIDDKVDNVLEVVEALPSCNVALMDQPHNQHLNDQRIERVENFNKWLTKIK